MTESLAKRETSICIGCGLCCDGTLHSRATVRADDEANVVAVGLEIGESGGERFFRQPCPHYSCGSCSVYARRPQVCRTYRCALLRSLEAGIVSEEDARAKIATAKELLATVRALDPNAVTPADRAKLANHLKAQLGSLRGPEREAAAKMLLDTAVLEHFLDRWFLTADERATAAEAAKDAS